MGNAVEAPTRCIRCATILRSQRPACPSCGLEAGKQKPASPRTEVRPVDEAPEGGPAQPKAATAKAGVKICPVCLSTVPEDKMQDLDGQLLCADCHASMAKKAARQ